MTPWERLYAAIDGRAPDRVPAAPKIWVDLGAQLTGTDLVEVVEDPLVALRVIAEAGAGLGVDAVRQFPLPARRTEEDNGVVYELDARGRRLGPIDLQAGLATRLERTADFVLEDPRFITYYQFWHTPEPAVADLADARRVAVPDARLFDELGWAKNQQVIRDRFGDRLAFIADCAAPTLAFLVALRGMERALFDLIEAPDLAHAVFEKGAAASIARGKYWLDHGYTVLRLNDSAANMSVISPRAWREFIFPHFKTIVDELHRYDPAARIYCHICGNILPIADDLVATGLDCLGPLDPLGSFTAGQMRAKVGDRVALMGGVDTQAFVRGTPEEVIEQARVCMVEAGARGGYVLASGCVIPRSAKRENLEALVRAAREFGRYRDGELAAS